MAKWIWNVEKTHKVNIDKLESIAVDVIDKKFSACVLDDIGDYYLLYQSEHAEDVHKFIDDITISDIDKHIPQLLSLIAKVVQQ